MTTQTNRLATETSPYLLQHAHNPVDWHPWGEEALALARRENRPILLSIGYSACHWCHVMAHESFENPAIAAVMNRLFVNIKVDREERPDLDKIYQSAHQLLTGRPGGWPLTVFLTPDDHHPYFAGTYFPPASRHGMPGFAELLEKVAAFYHEHPEDVAAQNRELQAALAQLNPPPPDDRSEPDSSPLDVARQQLAQHFDSRHGGFGQAPKFPHPTNLERLLRHYAATAAAGQPDEGARNMVLSTLQAMAAGGLYDQLGGGFYRYSVDEQWMIPHFEKMLYDNGPLLALYSEAWQAFGTDTFRRIALETGEWVQREMQAPQGGYYSTLDADSEGEEGRFYVWTPDAVRAVLSEAEYALFAPVFGLDRPANFEGRWHLHRFRAVPEVAQELGLAANAADALLQTARHKLLAARTQRVRPGRDEKILTAWNGLMIKGMATAGRLLERSDFITSATRSVDFIRSTLFVDGRLRAGFKDGQARFMAYLDDHVFLIDGLLALLEARWRGADLQLASDLAEILLAHFEDTENGGFFFTADDHEALIHRPKPTMDDALPAGNAIAARVLGRLGHLLGEPRYLAAAERTLRSSWPMLSQMPYAHCALLDALEEYLYAPETIILRGSETELPVWQQACRQGYAPRRLVLAIPDSATDLPVSLAERKPLAGPVAYRCTGMECQPPVTTLEEIVGGDW